jgi:hypothetical protein
LGGSAAQVNAPAFISADEATCPTDRNHVRIRAILRRHTAESPASALDLGEIAAGK